MSCFSFPIAGFPLEQDEVRWSASMQTLSM